MNSVSGHLPAGQFVIVPFLQDITVDHHWMVFCTSNCTAQPLVLEVFANAQ